MKAPSHICDKHWQELKASAIAASIASLNFRSLEGNAPFDDLMYSDGLPRRNDGRLINPVLTKYKHLRRGGWRCSGVEPATGEEMLWRCFKPDFPRTDEGGKSVKYEHPPKTETRAFFLRVPLHIWQAIASRYGVKMPAQIELNSETGEAIGFWKWVLDNPSIPIVLTEGAKKAACLLSAGYVGVALPGITSGFRTPKDGAGNRITKPRYLIPDLKIFAHLGRCFYIAFDQDVKRKTIRAVNTAIAITGRLLKAKGCTVYVVRWAASQKGVDDLIATHGVNAFTFAYEGAQMLSSWQRRAAYRLTYAVNLRKCERYLGDIAIPEKAKIIGIKSPKGTGKTETIARMVADAQSEGVKVLVITHRVQLGEALCERFGVPYVTQIRESEFGTVFGYGLCIDSLHPNSQARFNAADWEDALIIIDEAEQVIWHLLNASTDVKTHRPVILEQFKQLIQGVVEGTGKIIVSDADLSDTIIDYIKALAEKDLQPWICVNDYRPELGWEVYNYSGGSPAPLLSDLEVAIACGEKPLILCSAQKISSRYGTQTLERWLSRQFPALSILRIDSESVSDPQHAAYSCIASLNELLPKFDIVIASPSIETGVSIDIQGHFTSVWGIFQGVQSDNSVRQALARLRENVPRHVWIAKKSGSLVGNGATISKHLLETQSKLFKAHVNLLMQIDFDLDGFSDSNSLKTWASLAARHNAGKRDYRAAILEDLVGEGHTIIEVELDQENIKTIKQTITLVKTENHEQAALEEAAVELPTKAQYEKLQSQKAKTKTERHQERKYSRWLKYGVDVTKELILRDDAGWYPKLVLHYYCTLGRAFVAERDKQRAAAMSERGAGRVWIPDFNRSQIGASVLLIEKLGVLNLLNTEREYRSTDEDLIALADMVKANAQAVKAVLGFTVHQDDTAIAILQNLLGKLGLKLRYLRREGSNGQRCRVYGWAPPSDSREEIFEVWLSRDAASTPSNDLNLVEGDAA